MTLQWLASAFVALTLAGCFLMVAISVSFWRLLRRHEAMLPDGVEREHEALAAPLPDDDALPHVVVQIASFNEGELVERSIAQASALDWPVSKLHVQVCDDSTDETTLRAEDAARRARARGVDVTVVHRDVRRDFKAGALHEATARSEHEYFAIFDVDYVYESDFLRRCMAPLLADPSLGFVQARIDTFNGDQNALTRAQRVILDFHHGFEQAYRCWAEELLPFNGTGGVWRRKAMDAAGGWSGATVTEDLDLTCRAWMAGWGGTYLTSVTVRGEVPTRLGVWTSQHRRWMAGFGEVAVRMLPALLGDVTGRARAQWASSSPLVFWLACVAVVATLVASVAAVLLDPAVAVLTSSAVTVGLMGLAVVLFAVMRAANRFLRPGTSLQRFARDFLPVPLLSLYVGWASFRSVPATLLGRRRAFSRTPKVVVHPEPRVNSMPPRHKAVPGANSEGRCTWG